MKDEHISTMQPLHVVKLHKKWESMDSAISGDFPMSSHSV